MPSAPATRDLTIYAGTLYTKRFLFYSKDSTTGVQTPIDFTTYTARLVAKINPEDDGAAYEFSTTDGSIVLGAVAGSVDLIKTPIQTTPSDDNVIGFDEAGYVFYLIDGNNYPLPPMLIGNLDFDYSTLPSGG